MLVGRNGGSHERPAAVQRFHSDSLGEKDPARGGLSNHPRNFAKSLRIGDATQAGERGGSRVPATLIKSGAEPAHKLWTQQQQQQQQTSETHLRAFVQNPGDASSSGYFR